MKKLFTFIILIILILYFHNEVINGTVSGLLLWYQSIIPALLPFIIITNALSESHAYDSLSARSQKKNSIIYICTSIILGNICGYPIGAKIINDLSIEGKLDSDTSNSILALSSQASPMFLIGYTYPFLMVHQISIYTFFALIYTPVILGFIIFITTKKHKESKSDATEKVLPDLPYTADNRCYKQSSSSSGSFVHAAEIIVVIGIYVIIFSIILSILLPKINNQFAKCALSFLEITTGTQLISSVELPTKLKACLILSLSSFGGLCSAFQIKSVLNYSGASIKKYLYNKIILSAGTFFLTWLYLSYL